MLNLIFNLFLFLFVIIIIIFNSTTTKNDIIVVDIVG